MRPRSGGTPGRLATTGFVLHDGPPHGVQELRVMRQGGRVRAARGQDGDDVGVADPDEGRVRPGDEGDVVVDRLPHVRVLAVQAVEPAADADDGVAVHRLPRARTGGLPGVYPNRASRPPRG